MKTSARAATAAERSLPQLKGMGMPMCAGRSPATPAGEQAAWLTSQLASLGEAQIRKLAQAQSQGTGTGSSPAYPEPEREFALLNEDRKFWTTPRCPACGALGQVSKQFNRATRRDEWAIGCNCQKLEGFPSYKRAQTTWKAACLLSQA